MADRVVKVGQASGVMEAQAVMVPMLQLHKMVVAPRRLVETEAMEVTERAAREETVRMVENAVLIQRQSAAVGEKAGMVEAG